MTVLLVNPPIRLPRAFAHYPMFSTLGLLSNAAWLRDQGSDVQVVDAFTLPSELALRDDGDGFRHVGAEVEDVVAEVLRRAGTCGAPPIVIVALTMFSDMNRLAENLVPQVVEGLRRALPDASLGMADLYVCGMNYFPFDVPGVMRVIPGADWLLVGEAEPTLPEVVERLRAGRSIEGMPRLAVRRGDDITYDPAAPVALQNLDSLPLPAFDLLDMDRYFRVQAGALQADLVHEYHVVERQLPLMTSRSCPFRCHFCTNQVLGLPWRAHSVGYVRRAVRTLRERYDVKRLLLLDDNINVDATRFRELVVALKEEGVPWDAVNGYRADRLDREMVRAIKAAGNTKVTVSAESGDPSLLDKVIRKGLKLSSVVNLARICEEERIPLQVHYIVGVPGETKAQINQTLEFATVLFHEHGAWPLLQHAIPFPGTQLFRDCEDKGYFVAPPFEIPGSVLEVESIIRTPCFEPGEVIRMKRNAQHLHAAMQNLAFVSVEPRCDCACLSCHCHAMPKPDRRPTWEEIRAQLDRARFLGAREVLLGGGEPTMRPDLPAVVQHAKGMGFKRLTLVTNAHGLANPKRAAELAQAGVDAVAVDLMAPEAEPHDGLAGMPDAWKLTMMGLRHAKEVGWSIDVHIPVLKANLAVLDKTVTLALRLGARGVHLQIPPPDAPALEAGQVPRWSDAVGPMLQAIRKAPRGLVGIQGAPLCLLPSQPGMLRPLPPWALQASRAQKVKHPVCRKCVAYILCGGFFRPEHEPDYGMMDAAGVGTPDPSATAAR
jgi:radical SAM superfamily enzyme YgiQ (UPF0313 family)